MNNLLYISLLPVVLLLTYIYKKDVDKEPKGLLIKIFVFGCISCIPIAIIETIIGEFFPSSYIPSFFITLVSVFVGVGFVEEFGKWIITYKNVYKSNEFNHPYDGIVYAVFASLGFAAVENVLYVFSYGFQIGLYRAVLSVPSHMVDAVFMGYFLAKSKKEFIDDKQEYFGSLLLSILVPSITHTIYDAILSYYELTGSSLVFAFFWLFVIGSYIIAFKIICSQSKQKLNFDNTEAGIRREV